MKALIAEGEWQPRPEYPVSASETQRQRALSGSQVWRHPRFAFKDIPFPQIEDDEDLDPGSGGGHMRFGHPCLRDRPGRIHPLFRTGEAAVCVGARILRGGGEDRKTGAGAGAGRPGGHGEHPVVRLLHSLPERRL